MKSRTKIGLVLLVIVLLTSAAIFGRDGITSLFFQPTESSVQEGVTSNTVLPPEVVAQDLTTPWSVAFLPDADMVISERSGQLVRVGKSGAQFKIDGVRQTSEGGLLGIALHPDFSTNNYVYIYFTTDSNGSLSNQIDRYTLLNNQLKLDTTIIKDIPAASNHNGGTIAFGPDSLLYATTGDAAKPELAQDRASLAGKILRMNDDGSVPSDNPFSNLVWSYGHRNPQGIAWTEEGVLWSVEHGPSGPDTGRDELNLITKASNYGWPEITGDENQGGMVAPVAQSGDSETWAPAGIAYYNGSLYFAGLRGQSLYQAKINNDNSVSLQRHFSEEYGRLRAVSVYKDKLYISTSNRDGRGSPNANDDKILRIDPKLFQ